MAEPRIYSKNYVNQDDTFTVSHGSSSVSLLHDRDNSSQWVSVDADADATEVTIEIEFFEGSVATARTIDTLILLNHNLEAFELEYWDGSAWQPWEVISAEDTANGFYDLDEHETSKARLSMTATQTTNVEKRIGELGLCLLRVDINRDFAQYRVIWKENAVTIKKGDGSIQRQIKRFSPDRYEKYQADVAFDLVPLATLDSIVELRREGDPFLWQPESVWRPEELYYVDWVGELQYEYVSSNKLAGFKLGFKVAEV